MPAATFAIMRNLVIPCTGLIRGIWFKEKPSGIQWLAPSFANQDISLYSNTNYDNSTDLNCIFLYL